MQLRCNYRLYPTPTPTQEQALARSFGCARVVFNDGLRARQNAWKNDVKYPSDGDLSKQIVTLAKGTPERAWLSEVSLIATSSHLPRANVRAAG